MSPNAAATGSSLCKAKNSAAKATAVSTDTHPSDPGVGSHSATRSPSFNGISLSYSYEP